MLSPYFCYHNRKNYKAAVNMEKFIPYGKLSWKEKRKLDQARLQTWGELSPVTGKPANSKAYDRNKTRNWKREYQGASRSGTFICI
jgi:hypothetical protein